jgi:hypothetical protein
MQEQKAVGTERSEDVRWGLDWRSLSNDTEFVETGARKLDGCA